MRRRIIAVIALAAFATLTFGRAASACAPWCWPGGDPRDFATYVREEVVPDP